MENEYVLGIYRYRSRINEERLSQGVILAYDNAYRIGQAIVEDGEDIGMWSFTTIIDGENGNL